MIKGDRKILLSQKKAFFGIMSTFLLVSVFVSAFNIQPVNAEETIYIKADGSVEPQSAPIQRNGDLYTLTDNITNYAANATIVVERNNSMVDGAGFTVKGQPWDREKGSIGICVNRTNNVTIQNTNFDNPYTGILLSYSSNASIKGNNLTRHDYGILLDSSFNSSIDGNTVTYSVNGIYLASSYSNSIDGNSLTETEGIRFNSSSNNIIKRNNITKNYGGIRFDFFSDYNSIEENTVASSYVGICLYVSSQHNSIRGNNVTNNSLGGIVFDSTSNYNGIYENTIENNTVGLVVSYAEALKLNAAYGTTLFVSFGDTSNNMFYHNNVITNNQQVNIGSSGYAGVWDNGYPSGGNYWSDYSGTDLYNGPYQNETGSDGIGDVPYEIDGVNTDHYPLVSAVLSLTGDVNHDGIVDIYDAIVLAGAYSSVPGSSNWDPNADINRDNIVDIFDAILLASNFGRTM